MKIALLLMFILQITFCGTTMRNISKKNPRIFITYEDAQETSKKVWKIHNLTLSNKKNPQTTYQIKNLVIDKKPIPIDLPNGTYRGTVAIAKDTGYFSTARIFIKFREEAEYTPDGLLLLYREFKFPACYMKEADNRLFIPFLVPASNFSVYSCPPIKIDKSRNYTLKLIARKVDLPVFFMNHLGIEDIFLRIETTQ